LAHWLDTQIVDGSLDPARGADLIWAEVAIDLDYPDELQPVVECATQLADWDERWDIPIERLREDALSAARALIAHQGPDTSTLE